MGAVNDDARFDALLPILHAVHLGVYTHDGRRVLRGAERSPKDFYLYDFEVHILAHALGTKQTWPLQTLVRTLTDAGISGSGGSSLDAETLRQLLLNGTQKALRDPQNGLAREPFLVRELGLHHQSPYDLAKDVSTHEIGLDALQLLLLTVDFVGTPARTSPPGGAPSTDRLGLARRVRSARVPLQVGNCFTDTDFSGNDKSWDLPVDWAVSWYTSTAGSDISATTLQIGSVVERMHGFLLGTVILSTTVETPNGTQTHYGHATPGTPLIYRVRVFLDTPAPPIITCGFLLDYAMPPTGPVRGAHVTWSVGDLTKYGTIRDHSEAGLTDGSGSQTLTFDPNTEAVPGFGQELTVTGVLRRTLSFDISTGASAETARFLNLAGVQPGFADWSVSRHAPRGFKFEGVHYQIVRPADGYIFDATMSGRVCGEDPYAAPWEITWHADAIFNGQRIPGGTTTPSVSIPRGGYTLDAGSGASIHFTFMPGTAGDPQLQLGIVPFSPGYTTTTPEITVPVTEDTSCPAPTP